MIDKLTPAFRFSNANILLSLSYDKQYLWFILNNLASQMQNEIAIQILADFHRTVSLSDFRGSSLNAS